MADHDQNEHPYASRAGLKLAHAIQQFSINVNGLLCADIGSNAGGFVDCLLRAGAGKVYAIERGYGVLDYRLRRDPRVVVMERTDALHATLPERVTLVTIDAGWTRQRLILPPALAMLAPNGSIISLVKPHYEAADDLLKKGILSDEHIDHVLASVRSDISAAGLAIAAETESPIRGHGGNREFLFLLRMNPV